MASCATLWSAAWLTRSSSTRGWPRSMDMGVRSDREVLTSVSTLPFRARDEVEAALVAHGFAVDEVRGAPDRPGREFVFFARRPK
jgi:hypothetical protein